MTTSISFVLVILAVTSSVLSRPQCDCQRPIYGRRYVASLSGESSGNRLPCEHQAPTFFRPRTYVPVQSQPIQRYIERPTYHYRSAVPAQLVYRTVSVQAPPRGRSYLVKEITPQHSEPAPVQPIQTVSVPVEAPESHSAPVQTILEQAPAPAPVQTIIAEPAPAPVQTIVAAPAPVSTPTRIQTIYVSAPAPVRKVMQAAPAPPSMQTVVARPVASVPVQQVSVKVVPVSRPRIVVPAQRFDDEECPVHRGSGSDSDDSESLECTCTKK